MCHVEYYGGDPREMAHTRLVNARVRAGNLSELIVLFGECGVWEALEENEAAAEALWLMLYSMP